MKNVLASLLMLLTSQLALAQSKTYDFESSDPGCPNKLQIVEEYKAGNLESATITYDTTSDRYVAETLECGNLVGNPINQGGSYLTCALTELGNGGGYSLEIEYEEPSRDPSDYGFTANYIIEKSVDGVRAHWGARRFYDGQPIYCDYY